MYIYIYIHTARGEARQAEAGSEDRQGDPGRRAGGRARRLRGI